MSGDYLKKVKSRDPLRIPAQTFNTFIDAANDFQQRQRDIARKAQASIRRNTIIPIKNSTGQDLDRFSVVGIDSPIFTTSDNIDSFKNQPAIVGKVPTLDDHFGKFAVLLEPVKDGQVASGCVAGVCAVKLFVNEEWHVRADITDGEARSLNSCVRGSAQILWKEPGTGEVWALVDLVLHDVIDLFPVKLTVDGGTPGDINTTCSFTYKVEDLDDNLLGEGLTPKTQRIPLCEYLQPGAQSEGVGYAEKDNTFVLYHVAEERPKTDLVDVVIGSNLSVESAITSGDTVIYTFAHAVRTKQLRVLDTGYESVSTTIFDIEDRCHCDSGAGSGSGGSGNSGGGSV